MRAAGWMMWPACDHYDRSVEIMSETESTATECCQSCRYMYKILKYDYRERGCRHDKPIGYVCMGNADEHLAIWMVGVNPALEMCEMYEAGENNGGE